MIVQAMDALQIIQSEHRSLDAVLHCLDTVVAEARETGAAPDFLLLDAIVDYIDRFPDRVHHPKEDKFLFPALARRRPALRPILDALRAEHERCLALTAELRMALDFYRRAPEHGVTAFVVAVREYVDFQQAHLQREEREVIPVARQVLAPDEREALDRAFAENVDPMFGGKPEAEFEALFTRIVNLAPPPLGLGGDKPS